MNGSHFAVQYRYRRRNAVNHELYGDAQSPQAQTRLYRGINYPTEKRNPTYTYLKPANLPSYTRFSRLSSSASFLAASPSSPIIKLVCSCRLSSLNFARAAGDDSPNLGCEAKIPSNNCRSRVEFVAESTDRRAPIASISESYEENVCLARIGAARAWSSGEDSKRLLRMYVCEDAGSEARVDISGRVLEDMVVGL